jgi:hypothetical protein
MPTTMMSQHGPGEGLTDGDARGVPFLFSFILFGSVAWMGEWKGS